MTEVKICGLKDQLMLEAAIEAGADYVGFMFVSESPRAITVEQAGILLSRTDTATGVAVVSDANDDLIDAIRITGFPVIQLHGSETPERVREIKHRTGKQVWKAIGVRTRDDLKVCETFAAADLMLIDAKAPEGAAYAGGHGQSFDWSILKNWQAPKPWFLAGGLTPGNVAEAVAATGAPGVDVSSGVERARGVKDAELIKQFISATKAS